MALWYFFFTIDQLWIAKCTKCCYVTRSKKFEKIIICVLILAANWRLRKSMTRCNFPSETLHSLNWQKSIFLSKSKNCKSWCIIIWTSDESDNLMKHNIKQIHAQVRQDCNKNNWMSYCSSFHFSGVPTSTSFDRYNYIYFAQSK